MVGLKSVWLLIFSMLLFGACVPQKKQTECGSSEAFNSQLRSCVPIVQGPSAFINISSFSPLYTSTRYKNDTTPVTLTIAVSNPYNQSFTIEWEHNYNGAVQTIAGNVLTTSAFIPVLYSGNIGSNVITAKIISGGTVVDSHNFEVVLQENPRPNINTGTINPADYNPTLYPDNTGATRFSFTGRNNGATGIGGYRVFWTLTKNGVNVPAYAETDTFANTATNATNVFMYGANDGTSDRFDATALGVGNYVLRARMQDTISGDTVAEHQWNVTVRDPEFGFVSSAGSPLPSQDTIAFFGISYDDYQFQNSVPTPSQFCVTVSDPDGSYANGTASDPTNLNMVVRFYKDNSGTPIYEGKTTAVDDTVCFGDASAAEKDVLVYSDGSPTAPHYRAVTARVFDEQTGKEICQPGQPTCPVAYPISWSVLVKPLDTGVTGTFQSAIAGDNITYTSSGAGTRSATVTQNQAVTVRFIPSDGIVGYEGYDMRQTTGGGANSGFFQYDIVVKKSGATIATLPCKIPGAAFPYVGATDVHSCTFTWPAFDPTTGDHLDPGAYVAYLQVTDTGSPVPGSIGTVSNALTINATVSEPVNAPDFIPAPDILDITGTSTIVAANEGESIRFRVRVSEDEHDDYTLLIQACGLDATCAPASLTPVNTDSRVWGDPLYLENTTITYSIPEDILGSTASGTLYFKATLTDSPTNSAKSSSNIVVPNISITVNNANAAPTYNAAAVTPAVGATYDVFAGYQFTGQLNGALADTSVDTDERPNKYQWWIGSANDLNDPAVWTAIEGATANTLRWTPGPELTTTSYIAVCYSDGYPRTDADSSNAPDLDGDPNQLCQSLWTITPRTNSALLTTIASPNGEVAVHNVPSERISYVAYASNNIIHVEKVEYRADGTLGTPMDAVAFPALSSGTADALKNLSLVASDTSLYVAYLADATGVPGNAFRAHVRRFNISNLAGQGGDKIATAFNNTTGMRRKFGFSYTAVPVTLDCDSTAGNCVYDSTLRTVTFNGAAIDASSNDNITINGLSLDFAPSATKVVTEICSDCNANGQAQSLADAINAHPSALIQGLTAAASGTVVTLYGMEVDGTEVYSGTQAITTAGKILFNSDNNLWYWPMANADYPGGQNKIQVLRANVADTVNNPVVTNVMTTLDDVSAIDNAWSTDSPLQMYMAYIRLTGGTGKVNKFTINGTNDLVPGTPRTIVVGSGLEEIQLSAPLGSENPNVFVSSKDNLDNFWVSRLPATLASQLSYKIEDYGADAGNTTILDKDNVSRIHVVPARPTLAGGTTDEGRIVVVSKNTGADYQSYLFRWKTVATLPVLEATTTFDQNLEETSATSKLASFAPTSLILGSGGAVAAGNTNFTMGVARVRDDSEVEFNLLNTEVESINSTTNSPTGLYRPAYVK